MNIVNFSIDNELMGARFLGTDVHRKLKSTFTMNTYKNFKDIDKLNMRSLFNTSNFTSKLPYILREREFDLSKTNLNKIFTSQWLDDRKVIMGTKCNKLVILDTVTGQHSIQSPLKSHPASINIQNHCGIHSIAINPSRTLLATGAEHVNDIAIYSLPSMEPVSVGYNAHSYWIFDLVWLDDEHVVSGAGDNRLALWTLNSSNKGKSANSKTSFINSNENIYKRKLITKSRSANSSFSSTTSPRTARKTIPSSLSASSARWWSSFYNNNLYSNSNKYLIARNPESRRLYIKRPLPYNFYANNLNNNTNNQQEPNTSANNEANATSTNSNVSSLSTSSLNLDNSFIRHRFNFQFNNNQSISNLFNINNTPSSRINRQMPTMRRQFSFSGNYSDLSRQRHGQADQDDDDMNNDELESDFNAYFNRYDNDSDMMNESLVNEIESNEINELVTDSDFSESEDEEEGEREPMEFNYFDLNRSSMNANETESSSDEEEDDDFENEFRSMKRRRLNINSKYSNCGGYRSTNNDGGLRYRKPTKIIKCKQSKRIRALAYNPKRNEIAAISMNAAFHYFDVKRFEQKYTKKLSPLKENVCLTINDDYSIYAIGSSSHVQLLDANNARPLTRDPILVKNDIGIRSLHFRNSIVSIGTGIGTVLFYDLRAHKFLNTDIQNPTNSSNEMDHLKLQTNRGWILRNETYYENLPYAFNTDNCHAIYSHSYDPSGTQMLTVGGPLTVNLYGHYAALWR